MKRALVWLVSLGGLAGSLAIASPLAAQDFGQSADCYWCIRDAIYEDTRLIARLEADPEIDEGIKGPQILAARADIHRLRALLGPLQFEGPEPCCYGRRPLHIR